jgi:hypothetical protein
LHDRSFNYLRISSLENPYYPVTILSMIIGVERSSILVTVLFVDTTGVTIENDDLPQTEKLHHNNVLCKPGYM